MLNHIDRWVVHLSRLLMVVAALWAFGMAIYIFVDVACRAFNVPLVGTFEVIRTSIIMIAFMQLAYCVISGSMLRADFVLSMVPKPVQRVINIVGYLLGAGVFALVCYGSFDPTTRAWVTGDFDGEGALRVPIWPSQLTVLLTCALVTLNYFILAAREVFPDSDAGSTA